MATRTTLIISLLAAPLALFGASSAAAQTISGTTTVSTLLAYTLLNTDELDFGVILQPTTAGTLTMDPQTGALTPSGSITLAGGSPSTGKFLGLGTPLRNVIINGPANITLTRSGGTQTMTINTLRMSINGGAPRVMAGAQNLGLSGLISIAIGGRLNVGANQAAGTYNGTYIITANYQ